MFEVITLDEKVDKQIKSLPHTIGVKMLQNMELLAEFGNELREPFSKSLGDGLFELRARGKRALLGRFTLLSKINLSLYLVCLSKSLKKRPKARLIKLEKS